MEKKSSKQAINEIVQSSANLVKPELRKKWGSFVEGRISNVNDVEVLKAAVRAMQALTDGDPFDKVAEKGKNPEGKYYDLWRALDSIVRFHAKGEEFRVWMEANKDKLVTIQKEPMTIRQDAVTS
jgi:hypothetical protein